MRRKKRKTEHLAPQPIQKAKYRWEMKLDRMYMLRDTVSDFYVRDLDNLLAYLFHHFPKTKISKWRSQYQKSNPSASLWEMIRSFEDQRDYGSEIKTLHSPLVRKTLTDDSMNNSELYLQALENLELYQGRKIHIKTNGEQRDPQTSTTSTTCSETGNEVKQNNSRSECSICFEVFPRDKIIQCKGTGCHTICRLCFHRYVTETLDIVSPSLVPCPECKTPYTVTDVRTHLPEWDFKELERKDQERNVKVAMGLSVKATLFCECGLVAVVEETAVGSGVVLCECKREYCLECGNFYHFDEPCPPPRETIQWIDKYAKRCPNCKTGIQKNGGCNHMKCTSCGYQFCWLCLGVWNVRCGCRVFGNRETPNPQPT